MSKDLHGLDPPADVETVNIGEIQNLDSPPTPSFEDEKELAAIEAKYSPSEEALQLPPGAGGEGDDAFAAQPSIFDDPDLRKFYWPRHNYENIHRFFPDFKWTVGEERRYPITMLFFSETDIVGLLGRLIGGLRAGVASCSLPFNWIEAISLKPTQTTFSLTWA